MKQLTFKGFLKKYLIDLSYQNTSSVTKCLNEVSTNVRLYEPLMLYSLLTLDKKQLSKLILKNERLKSDYEMYFFNFKSFDNFNLSKLPTEYQKVFTSYESVKNQKQTEDHLKKLMLNKIRNLQAEKKVSTYRIYTDLKLNHGNVNDFIKNEALNKLSLDSTRMILNYLV